MLSWEEYTAAMRARFGNCAYDDPLADMKNLKQEILFNITLIALMSYVLGPVFVKIKLSVSF